MLDYQRNNYPSPMPRELLVAIFSASPILELKGGIPMGRLLGLPIEAAFFWAIIGNTIPVPILLKYLEPIGNWLMKHSKWANKYLTKIFETTQNKHHPRFQRLGAIILLPVTAIPFPGSGAWTAALIAYLFKVPFKKALLLIFAGIICGGLIVSVLTESAVKIPGIFYQ